jgi:tripartite-type tricarboxylate transporter receptor subunit TctC
MILSLLAPAGTPRDVISRMSSDVAATVATPEIRKIFLDQGGESVGSTPEALAQRLVNDSRKYAEAARAAKIQPE